MAATYYSLNYYRLYDPERDGNPLEVSRGENAVTVFPITFSFDLTRSTLEVRLDEVVIADGWSYDEASRSVIFTEAPQGNYLLVRRVTDLTTRAVVFSARSMLSENEQNRSALQLFEALQEAVDLATWLKEGEYDIDAINMLAEIRDQLVAQLEALQKQMDEIEGNFGSTISSLLDRLSALLEEAGDLEDLIARVEALDVDCRMPPYSAITAENSGHPVVADFPTGSMDDHHRIVLEFNDETNLFYNNGPTLLYGGSGGKFLTGGWAGSTGCLKVDQEEDAIEFYWDGDSFGEYLSGTADNQDEDYFTTSFRMRCNETLPSGTRRAVLELYSSSSTGVNDLYGPMLLTMAWSDANLLQFELWNNNDAPGIVWANARLLNLFDGTWHLIEWRWTTRNAISSYNHNALWFDGQFIPYTYKGGTNDRWFTTTLDGIRVRLGKGTHPNAVTAETRSYNYAPQATFEPFCPARYDELIFSDIRRHENEEDYTPETSPVVGGGASFIISEQGLDIQPVKVTGAGNTTTLTCEVTNMEQSADNTAHWSLTGSAWTANYHMTEFTANNVFTLYPAYCVYSFGSENLKELYWRDVTPTVPYEEVSYTEQSWGDGSIARSSSYEAQTGTIWSHLKDSWAATWYDTWQISPSSSSYWRALVHNFDIPPLRIETIISEDPYTLDMGYMTNDNRHGASYGKYLRGMNFVGNRFLFIPQMTAGTAVENGQGRTMFSFWFRPSTSGPDQSYQCLYMERNIVSGIRVNMIGSRLETYWFDRNTSITTSIEAALSLFDGNWHHYMAELDAPAGMIRMALDGEVVTAATSTTPPVVADLNTDYFRSAEDGTSNGDCAHYYTCFGAVPQDLWWGKNTSTQTNFPMINFYQGDLDEFVSWRDPEITTNNAFREIVAWMYNNGAGVFWPGYVGAMTQSYVPRVGDMGVVVGGIFLPTGTSLANAIAGVAAEGETDDDREEQTTDDAVTSPIEENPYNDDNFEETMAAWTGGIRIYIAATSEPFPTEKVTRPAVLTASNGEPYIGTETILVYTGIMTLTTNYVSGEGNSRVWSGDGAVISYDTQNSCWSIVISREVSYEGTIPESIEIYRDDEGNMTGYDVKYHDYYSISVSFYMSADQPVSAEWTHFYYTSTSQQYASTATGGVGTYFIVEEES